MTKTKAEKIIAVTRCRCGEKHADVAHDLKVSAKTVSGWVDRLKGVKTEGLLDMLKQDMADHQSLASMIKAFEELEEMLEAE